MSYIILLLLVAATSGISGQPLLFDKTIPEQNLPEASRLKSEMRSQYINSRYVSQLDFLSQQDFFKPKVVRAFSFFFDCYIPIRSYVFYYL